MKRFLLVVALAFAAFVGFSIADQGPATAVLQSVSQGFSAVGGCVGAVASNFGEGVRSLREREQVKNVEQKVCGAFSYMTDGSQFRRTEDGVDVGWKGCLILLGWASLLFWTLSGPIMAIQTSAARKRHPKCFYGTMRALEMGCRCGAVRKRGIPVWAILVWFAALPGELFGRVLHTVGAVVKAIVMGIVGVFAKEVVR